MSKVNSNAEPHSNAEPQSPINKTFKKYSPMSPPANVPRDTLKQKLKDRISRKQMTRKSKVEKKKMLDRELVKMGVDTKKFYESLTELNVSKKQMETVISKT